MKITNSKKAGYPTIVKYLFSDKAHDVADFKAKPGETAVRYEKDDLTIIYCGLGKEKEFALHKARSASANAARIARQLERTRMSIILPDQVKDKSAFDLACVEGLILGAYNFSAYKSENTKRIKSCQIVGAKASVKTVKKTAAVCEAVCFARDLVNDNAEAVYPEMLASQAREIGKQDNFSVSVITEKQMEKKGLGLIHAVGRGSWRPPRLIIMEYKGAPGQKKKTAIVGKGITFDSGGQNLKPTGAIEDMRTDMAGAGAVLGVMKALGVIGPIINVVGVIAAAHNAIGSRSYFPGDIYKSYIGKTVEIINTDAEGRLVLADAVAYCEKNSKPTEIIDIATLTGGILIALGQTVAGLFSHDDELAKNLFDAGEDTRERLWRFPLYEEYARALKSDKADLQNVAKLKRGYASAITGAAFISEFVTDTAWAHLDIAGTAYNEGPAKGETPKFATGFGVRLILKYLGVI